MQMTFNVQRTIPLLMIIALTCAMLSLPVPAASEDWKAAFDDVCSKVQGADSLSHRQIEDMIKKADKILPEIQSSNDPGKKVYVTRLKRCRGVYEFMLDTKATATK